MKTQSVLVQSMPNCTQIAGYKQPLGNECGNKESCFLLLASLSLSDQNQTESRGLHVPIKGPCIRISHIYEDLLFVLPFVPLSHYADSHLFKRSALVHACNFINNCVWIGIFDRVWFPKHGQWIQVNTNNKYFPIRKYISNVEKIFFEPPL